MAFSPISVAGYNANPPEDDGSEVPTNEVTWAGIKGKLNDPLKTAFDALVTELERFFSADFDGTIATAALEDLAVSTAKIAADAVTFAKMQNVTSDRLLGRDTASSGDVEEISVAAPLAFSGSGALGVDAATTAAAGKVELATAAEMVTGTDTGRVPSVATTKNHEGVAKAWGYATGAGSLQDSYGVTSVVRNSEGVYTVALSVTMANDDYAVAVTPDAPSGGTGGVGTRSTTGFTVRLFNLGGTTSDLAFSFVVLGTLA